jgi:hypothetical protein
MRRPKISEMDAIQLARFRLLQVRRRARRNLSYLTCLNVAELSHQEKETLAATVKAFRSIIAVTKPAWIAKAGVDDARRVLDYIGGKRH